MTQHYFEDSQTYAIISGYKKINSTEAENYLKKNRKQASDKVSMQFFNAELIATEQHLYFSVLNALLAFQNKTNQSKSLAMEVMLYAASQRQIQKAIEKLGIKQGQADLATVIVGQNLDELKEAQKELESAIKAKPDNSVLDISNQKKRLIKNAFQITNPQLETLKNKPEKQAIIESVVEKVALLSTQL